MKRLLAGLVIGAVFGVSGLNAQDSQNLDAGAKSAPAAAEVALKAKTLRSWKLVLPEEQWMLVGTGWHFEGTHGKYFSAKPLGTSLQVDVDGDSKFDVTLEADAKRSLITLRGKDKATYAMFVEPNQAGWVYRTAHVRRGKIGGTKFRLIDQNNNGQFNEFGKDAMIVGNGRYASMLSKVVNIDGKLHEIDVAADGSSVKAKAFEGKSGVFDLASGLKSKAKLLSAVVQSTDGKYSFELAKAAEGMEVPVGRYRLLTGRIALGSNQVNFRTGNSTPFAVKEGAKTPVGWGGPVKATFEVATAPGKVQMDPQKVWYFGDQNEEYYGWNPDGKSPKFILANKKTGEEIGVAYFPGSG